MNLRAPLELKEKILLLATNTFNTIVIKTFNKWQCQKQHTLIKLAALKENFKK